MTAPKLTARTIAAVVRRAIGAGNASTSTGAQTEIDGALVTGSVRIIIHGAATPGADLDALGRLVRAELLRSGYEVAATSASSVLTVVLPEPTDAAEPVIVPATVVEQDAPRQDTPAAHVEDDEPLHNEGDPIENPTGESLGSTSGVWTPTDDARAAEHGDIVSAARVRAAAALAEEPAEEGAPLVERVAAVLDATIIPIASVRPYGEGRALVTIGDRVTGEPQRYADTGSIAGRHYSARSALARAGYRETPAGGTQIIVEDREPAGVDEPGPEVDDPREEPRPVEWSEVAGPEVHNRSAGSRLSNAAVLSMLRNGGAWAEQDPRVVGPDRA